MILSVIFNEEFRLSIFMNRDIERTAPASVSIDPVFFLIRNPSLIQDGGDSFHTAVSGLRRKDHFFAVFVYRRDTSISHLAPP